MEPTNRFGKIPTFLKNRCRHWLGGLLSIALLTLGSQLAFAQTDLTGDVGGNYAFGADSTSILIPGDFIWDATAIYENNCHPVDLNAFAIQSIANTWESPVRDKINDDTGSFSSWQFNAAVAIPEPANTALMVCGGIIFFILVSYWRRAA